MMTEGGMLVFQNAATYPPPFYLVFWAPCCATAVSSSPMCELSKFHNRGLMGPLRRVLRDAVLSKRLLGYVRCVCVGEGGGGEHYKSAAHAVQIGLLPTCTFRSGCPSIRPSSRCVLCLVVLLRNMPQDSRCAASKSRPERQYMLTTNVCTRRT